MCQSGESNWAQALLSVNSQSSKRDRKEKSLIVLHSEKIKWRSAQRALGIKKNKPLVGAPNSACDCQRRLNGRTSVAELAF